MLFIDTHYFKNYISLLVVFIRSICICHTGILLDQFMDMFRNIRHFLAKLRTLYPDVIY